MSFRPICYCTTLPPFSLMQCHPHSHKLWALYGGTPSKRPRTNWPRQKGPVKMAPDDTAPSSRPRQNSPVKTAPDITAPDKRASDITVPVKRAPDITAPVKRAPDITANKIIIKPAKWLHCISPICLFRIRLFPCSFTGLQLQI